MSHVLIQVRDEVITRLKAGVPSVANRVYRYDEVPPEEIPEDLLPAVVVWLGDDHAERVGENGDGDPTVPSILEDITQVIYIACAVKTTSDPEKTAYDIRSEVETTLLGTSAGLTLGGRVVMLSRVAGSNNRDDALEIGAYNVQLQLEALVRHLERLPTSFTY